MTVCAQEFETILDNKENIHYKYIMHIYICAYDIFTKKQK